MNGTSYLDSLTPLCIVMLRGFTYAAAMSYEYGGDLDINTIFLIIDHPFCVWILTKPRLINHFFSNRYFSHQSSQHFFSTLCIAFIEWGQSDLEFAKKLLYLQFNKAFSIFFLTQFRECRKMGQLNMKIEIQFQNGLFPILINCDQNINC